MASPLYNRLVVIYLNGARSINMELTTPLPPQDNEFEALKTGLTEYN